MRLALESGASPSARRPAGHRWHWLGGDELFGGYSSFRDIPRWVRLFALPSRAPFAGEVFRALADAAVHHFPRNGPKSGGLLTYGGSYHGAYLLRRGLFMPWVLHHVTSMAAEGLERLRPPSISHLC
jgi:asparagine synthase (glutamine-hydrolysing)